jgi:hypothetical protein
VLPPSAPQELQELSDSQNPNVTSATPQEFIEALTFFARPDDSVALRGLWTRATDARQAEGRAAALQELTDRTRHAAPASSSLPAMVRKSLPVRRLAMVAAAVCVLAFTAAGALLLTRRAAASHPGESAVPTVTREVAQSVQLSIASATAFVRESIEGVPDAPAGRGSDLKLPAPRRRPKPLASDTTAALAPPATAAAEAPRPDAALAGGGVPPARDLPFTNGASHALAAAPHGVYSASYPDVIPPALVRAQMPELPIGGVSMARPGALELLVGDDGQVLSAKLIPASNRHQDRMMVSAAKAWRFTPATRNGEPVSYRLHMPITW